MGIFLKRSRTAHAAVRARYGPKCKLFLDLMAVSSLPAKMKKILSKMKALDCEHDFPHYDRLGDICCHGNQTSNRIWPKI